MPPASTVSAAPRAEHQGLKPYGTQTAHAAIASRFDLLALAGRGTFAEVWQVRDRRTGRIHALKRLREDRQDQKAAWQILENEAEIGGRVSSPQLARVEEACLDADLPYLVLEWLSGRTLESRLIAERKLLCRDALWIGRQCAQGLHALVKAGFTHGDIKPSNIFLCADGVVKLIDLGFARPDRQAASELAEGDERKIVGTPEYMAPETMAAVESGGPARDVYSLGVTLYRMLTGVLPFQGQTAGEILKQQQQAVPQRLRSLAPHVPGEVDDLVTRLLSKQPLRRGRGLSWLIHDLIGLELSYLAAESSLPKSGNLPELPPFTELDSSH